MVLFHLTGMYDAEVSPDVNVSQVGPLELLILLRGKMCH